MINKNVIHIVVLFLIFAAAKNTCAQKTLESGLSIPVGDYAGSEASAAIGYNIRGGWDKILNNNNMGIALGAIFGRNKYNVEGITISSGSWSYFGIETGVLYQVNDQINLKGMLVFANGTSPAIRANSSGILESARANAFGFDLRVEYKISKVYISGNLLSFAPVFKYNGSNGILMDKQSISTLGLSIGYIF